MGKTRRSETGYINFDPNRQLPKWQREPKIGRSLADQERLGDPEAEKPPRANVLHIGSRLPKRTPSEDVDKGSQDKPVKTPEEELDEVESRIQSNEFNDDERRYIKRIIKDYGKDVYEAKKNIEDGGGVVGDKWIDVFRTSHIKKCKTWGLKRQLAPEKAKLIGKYLELKLPVGIPEEKVEIIQSDTEETKEKEFTPEQMAQIRVLLGIAVSRFKEYYMESTQWGDELGGEVAKKRYILDQMKKGMENLIRSDQFLKDIFPEEKISEAVEKTMEFAGKFDITK